MIGLSGERKLNRISLPIQRTEVITLFLRFEGISCQGITGVIGLGAHNDIAVTHRTVGVIHLQTRCAGLPTSAVFLDLTHYIVTHVNTERISDVDILTATVLHVHRTVKTADNVMMPVVIGRLRFSTVSFVQRRTHTAIRDPFEDLRHTEIRRQIQIIRIADDFLAVRVEIDGVSIQHHYRHQLFTDQRRPYILTQLLVLMIAKINRIRPCIRRIR